MAAAAAAARGPGIRRVVRLLWSQIDFVVGYDDGSERQLRSRVAFLVIAMCLEFGNFAAGFGGFARLLSGRMDARCCAFSLV